jgi:hypothetical protein
MKIATQVLQDLQDNASEDIDALCNLYADTRGCDMMTVQQRARIVMRCDDAKAGDRYATWTFFVRTGIPASRIRTRA